MMFTVLINMKIIIWNKDTNGYIATKLGYFMYLLLNPPLFFLARNYPKLYRKIFNKFLKGNWYRLIIFISSHKHTRNIRLIFSK